MNYIGFYFVIKLKELKGVLHTQSTVFFKYLNGLTRRVRVKLFTVSKNDPNKGCGS